MNRKAITIAALAIAAMPVPAAAAGGYYLRNDTGRTLTCGLMREHGSIMDRFTLRAGGEWSLASEGEGTRRLLCDIGEILPHFRLRSGVHYVLVNERGRFALRVAAP